ncbi:hypothetical protein [Methylobacterium sp. CM6257]
MPEDTKVDIKIEFLSSPPTFKGEPDGNNLEINVTNGCKIDALNGRVSTLAGEGQDAQVVAFSFVNARGGFDSKDLRLTGKLRGIHAEFELLNGTRVEGDVNADSVSSRVVNVALIE